MANEEFKVEEIAKAREAKWRTVWIGNFIKNAFKMRPHDPMETVIPEKTIIKLGSLLALGLGEAGANIIGQNMHGQREYLDAMIGGSRVECIIGVVRIREFNMNLIAEIVHGVVDEFHGSPNKNNGDSIANLDLKH